MKSNEIIPIIVHFPQTEPARSQLSQEIAFFHAQAVKQWIQSLPCSAEQKNQLLTDVIEATKQKNETDNVPFSKKHL